MSQSKHSCRVVDTLCFVLLASFFVFPDPTVLYQCLVNENEYIRRTVCECSEMDPSKDQVMILCVLCISLPAWPCPTSFFSTQVTNCSRRCTIEAHPNFSEAPNFRSSILHPKTDFRKNQIASRRIIPWPESRNRVISKSRLAFRRFGLKELCLSEAKKWKCATSIAEWVYR